MIGQKNQESEEEKELEFQIRNPIEKMSLEEKAVLCTGRDFWNTNGIERLQIPSLKVSDGPNGLRKQEKEMDHLGFSDSNISICYPSASSVACSFDKTLLQQLGEALGEECIQEDVNVLLGPGINMKRSPLCGRNFEYFSEDPYLTAELAIAYIKGVQSKGIGTCVKHFAANNQEYRRLTIDVQIDERTLREIYLYAFERVVKEAKPWSIMSAYNKLNGTYCSENAYLLQEILRNEWKYDGCVISDWGAVNDTIAAVENGLTLEMPGNKATPTKLVEAVENGILTEQNLEEAAAFLLRMNSKVVNGVKKEQAELLKEHHELARQLAQESIVLLKNENILPLNKRVKVAYIGEFAQNPRYQGSGSSKVNPYKIDSVLSALDEENVVYVRGYSLESNKTDDQMLEEAVLIAAKAEVAVIFVGLPDSYETEGYDREHMRLPDYQNTLIKAVIEVQKQVVVVLHNGAPIELPWADDVKGIIEAYLGGEAVGNAVQNILYGHINPSGRLAETFPMKLADNPSYLTYPGEGDRSSYQEGIFIGYRYYDKKEKKVRYPFGYGLSYTTFAYNNLQISKQQIQEGDTFEVSLEITNTGSTAGKEVLQIYVGQQNASVIRPKKELKAFDKYYLQPSETKKVSIQMDTKVFAYYDTDMKKWAIPSGNYQIMVAKSSEEIVLSEVVEVRTNYCQSREFTLKHSIGDFMDNTFTSAKIQKVIQILETIENNKSTLENKEMFRSMPLRAIMGLGKGKIKKEVLKEIVQCANMQK